MPLTLSIAQRHTLAPTLRQSFGETSGDIPLYSLHRIRKRLARRPPGIDGKLRLLLWQHLIAGNAAYKKASGNDWSCLTSHNLVDAIEATDRDIAKTIDAIKDMPRELALARNAVLAKLHDAREGQVALMRQWFEDHAEQVIYTMNGQIPWSVVARLRRDLGRWIAGIGNPFSQPIEDMILEVARDANVATDDPEEAWTRMGGRIFTKRSN